MTSTDGAYWCGLGRKHVIMNCDTEGPAKLVSHSSAWSLGTGVGNLVDDI